MSSAFKYIDSKASIPPPLMDVVDKKVNIHQSNPIIQGDSFTAGTSLRFEFVNSAGWVDMSDSYLNFRVSLTKGDGTALNAAANTTFNFNPASCIFSSASYRLNDKVIASANNIAQTEAYMYRKASKEWKNTVGSAAWLDDWEDRQKRVLGKKTHDIEWTPVCLAPFSASHQMFPPGLKHNISFEIEQDWKIRLLECLDATVGAGYKLPVAKAIGALATDIKVVLEKVELCVVEYRGEPAPSGVIYYDYKNVLTTYDNLTNSVDQRHKFTVPPNLFKMSLAIQKTAINTTLNNVTKFKGAGAANTQDEYKLTSFQMRLGSRTYPEVAPELVLQGDALKGAYKIWKDTMNNQNIQHTATESFTEWLQSPYYTFAMPRDITEIATQADVQLYFKLPAATVPELADPSTSSVFAFSETTSICAINFGQSPAVVEMTEAAYEPA